MSSSKKCRCCGKEISFISKEPLVYVYKDELGYYCSYKCFREKGLLKDEMINATCLGKEKEKQIKELTMRYFMFSGDSKLAISNIKAIEKSCSKEELNILLADKKVREYYLKIKNLKEKSKNEDDSIEK